MTRISGSWRGALALIGLLGAMERGAALAESPTSFAALQARYAGEIRPLMTRFCLKCHSTDRQEGDLDLERFAKLDDVRAETKVWLKVAEMLDNGEMPPKKSKQPASEERKSLRGWVEDYLHAEAYASAGDPGPVLPRRLNNAEYTYTVNDLTGLDLQPAREFPADGAAGEGFTNAGNALVMSPSLLTKYLDAAKGIAAHAMLVPDGMRFTPGTSRRDWSDELLAQIRSFYARFADAEGRLPLGPYLAATLDARDALAHGTITTRALAGQRGLNERYLAALWDVLTGKESSLLIDGVRARWRAAKPGDAAALSAEIGGWQNALARFQSVGHERPWVTVVNPALTRQELRFKFPERASGPEVVVYLAASAAGSGDSVVWERPRLVRAGRPDLMLVDVREFTREIIARRERTFAAAAQCLAAAAEAGAMDKKIDRADLAKRYGVEEEDLGGWLDYLGIGTDASVKLDLLARPTSRGGGYEFVNGWSTNDLPNLVANSSDRAVRIPGNLRPHSVAVHPSPTECAAVGWRSPAALVLRIEGAVTHAHPECGNGVTWTVELRRGATRRRLAAGTAAGPKTVKVGPIENVPVQQGDLLSLLIGPRDGNHACDLTEISLTLRSTAKAGPGWDLAGDISSNVHAGNPHGDRQGHAGVWHFYKEPVTGTNQGPVVPAGSVLARWLAAPDRERKQKIAQELQRLLTAGAPPAKDHPDAALYHELASMGGPLFARRGPAKAVPASQTAANASSRPAWGLDPGLFGRRANGPAVDPASLCLQAPSVLELRLPADLVAGGELVSSAVIPGESGGTGVVQVRLLAGKPASLTEIRPDAPILVAERGPAREQVLRGFDEFRRWFPLALCYNRIVPVDEVVTLTLYHREDEPLRRLMLSDAQRAQLDRLWSELHFASQDALTIVDAFAQIMEYATQDSDPSLIEPYRKPINERAAAFRKAVVAAEPRQLDALIEFAALAYRRPLSAAETNELRALYRRLRAEELGHEDAWRLTLARVLIAPAFLYRLEQPAAGKTRGPVSDWELASRLSYFLWSSAPDAELRAAAASGRLHEPDVLAAQARRMLRDPRVRRLATEFACQWIHVYDFNTQDEKSERHFPTFAALRGDMYEETIRFFTDLFKRDASVLAVFDSDSTILNEAMARHYGIPGVTGPEWRRVEGVRKYGRGGVLGLATTLAQQSGASRTSPILRGNWICEALLGDKLPKPPKNVPLLPEDEASNGDLTVRQLVERHTSDKRCIGCHARIDPFGYALEGFDAIGRSREKDLGGRPVDTHAKLRDGVQFVGIDGLRDYLLTTKRAAVLRQFCRKLLGYSLGRGLQLSDEPLLEDLERRLAKNDFRFSVAVDAIVRSPQFREIRGKEMVVADGP